MKQSLGFANTGRLASKSQPVKEPALKAIDLFSGCGGLSHGMALAGIEVVSAVDSWAQSLVTLNRNHQQTDAIQFDLGAKDLAPLLGRLSDAELVIGGPPCQGFSISGKRDPLDPRNMLYKGFLKIVSEVRPQLFLMENVPNLSAMNKGELINEIEADFTDLGYKITREILLASDYGVPQNRKRLILIGTLRHQPFVMPRPTTRESSQKVTCNQAIGDLPEHSVLDGDVYPFVPFTNYQKMMRKDSRSLFNHQTTNHSTKTKRIIKLVPDGGNYKDLPEEYRGTRKVNIAWTRFASNKPSFTIDTGHRHHFHYLFDRVPTVRESARLQSFSDDFVFTGSKTDQYKQVGNAVPPLLGQALGRAISAHLRDEQIPLDNAI